MLLTLRSQTAHGSAFSPASLSPAAWFKFNTGITQAGGFVSQWDDQSGNARHLVQASGTNQPAVSAGVITFDGADNYMKCSAFTLNQAFSVFIVGKQVTWTSSDHWFDGNTAFSAAMYQAGVTPNVTMYAGSNAPQSSGIVLDTFYVIATQFNGASSSIQIDNAAATTGNSGANNAGGFTLAARGSNTVFGNIAVEEICIFPAVISGADLTNLYAYLAAVRDA